MVYSLIPRYFPHNLDYMRKRISFRLLKNLPAHEKRITVPTLLTILRMLLTPCIVAAMVTQHWGTAFILFLISVITDFLDGTIARVFGQKTFLGACLDPLADKFLLISCFFTLAFVQSPLFSIPWWFFFLVLLKESILIIGAVIIFSVMWHIEIMPTFVGTFTAVV